MQTEAEMRLHRCCFTGHRPEKLRRSELEIRLELENEIRRAIQEGYYTFITGMARGVDIWAAEIVLQFKREGCPVHLICACPFLGFENSWSAVWKNKYRTVLKMADLVRYISQRYDSKCFQIRNEWMVNHSSRMIAVFNGKPSGTKNTIDYAMSRCVPVFQIEG
jgi:uncharacterized phage-like protein YoqJ